MGGDSGIWRVFGVAGTAAAIGLSVFASGTLAEAPAKKKRPAASLGDVQLTAFRSCGQILRYGRRHPGAARAFTGDVIPESGGPRKKKGGGDALQPVSGGDDSGGEPSSPTNVQEPGVDEPDLVKAADGRMFIVDDARLHAVQTGPGGPVKVGSLRLRGIADRELLLHGNRLLVLSSGLGLGLVLQEVDVSDPTAMRLLRTLDVPGDYVDARMHDGVVRVVVSSVADFDFPQEGANRRAKPAPRPTAVHLPRAQLTDHATGQRRRSKLVHCGGVRRSSSFSGLDLLTVLTIDLDQGLPPIDSDAVMTNGSVVYASDDSLYVATDPYRFLMEGAGRGQTGIHKFSLGPAGTTYVASGGVAGHMLNQWSMSEREDLLRVASTTFADFSGRRRRGQSFVTVLAQNGDRLEQVGRVGGLGRGERIYAVRFFDEHAFVVTFREIDPLYTLDLSAPAAPAVVGELKIRGYSAYLHPISDQLLLGVGQDATAAGVTRGTQLSLFDVSNLAAPTLVSQAALGGESSSEAEYDHHAFLYWAPEELVVVPAQIASRKTFQTLFSGAIGFRAGAGGVQELARISHGPPPGMDIRRAVVVGDDLYTVSHRGILVSDLSSFGTRSWVLLNPPPPSPRKKPRRPAKKR